MPLKSAVKRPLLRRLGYQIEKIDPLEESIPATTTIPRFCRALETLYDKAQPGGVIMFDECGDARWPGATKANDAFFSDKPETVWPHPKCTWKFRVANH